MSGKIIFNPLGNFLVLVPTGYSHKNQLAGFKNSVSFSHYCKDITDQNFDKVSVQLKPGQNLEVEIYHIEEFVPSQRCLDFVKSNDGIFVGAQGLSLIFQQKKEKFPVGGAVISFDEKRNIFSR
jgi:hypothetical protein